jgi:hypothetical protein
MALGLKVLAVLFAALFVVIAVVVLPSHPLTAGMFRCFVNVGECLTNGPVGLTTSKMITAMSYYGTWQANERGRLV